jgi:putative ABC transport system permease protein
VGDTISFNLAGRVLEAEIANIRKEIDWENGRLNFLFIVNRGIIEQAPQTLAAGVDVPRADEVWLLDNLAEEFSNITPINVRDLVEQLDAISRKLGYAVRGIAAVTLIAGILVVAAAVQVSYSNRLMDIGIMRALGATRPQARAMVLAEHGLMAAIASLPALIIGVTGAWIVVRFVLKMEWFFAPLGVAAVLFVAVAVLLTTGTIMVTRLLGRKTASILRQS